MSLHDEIMNIGCDASMSHFSTLDELLAYKTGHRDARHAAAELAIKLEAQRDQLREALRELEHAYSREVNWEFAGRGDKNPSVTSRPALKARAALAAMEGE